MPPKATGTETPKKTGMDAAEFLMHCIRNGKEKLNVDFAGVAAATGMSKGGAANKFRAIVKDMEKNGALWATTDSPGGKKTAAAAPKRKTSTTVEKSPAVESDDGEEDDEEEEGPPKKKGRAANKKGTATIKKKGVMPIQEESEMDEVDSEIEDCVEDAGGVAVGDDE